MDVTRESRGHLRRFAAWFQATPAELAGLCVLVAGAAVASLVLWSSAERRPDQLPSTAAEIGAPVDDEAAPTEPWPSDSAQAPDPTGLDGRAEVEPDELTVHVTGAVDAPGLVILPAGARVGDAVAAAGGPTADADPDRINLARPVEDGQRIHLPRQGEELPPELSEDAGTAPGGDGLTADGRVDLNRATVTELETLPGIGPAKAAAIVEHRERNGPFGAPGELRAVPGIGEVTFQRLADLVVVR